MRGVLVLFLCVWLAACGGEPERVVVASFEAREIVVDLLEVEAAWAQDEEPRLGELCPAPTDAGRDGADMPAILLAPGRPNIGFWTLSVLGIVGYYVAVRTLKRRGEAWSGARIGSWIGAWAVVIYLASTGLWEYSSMQFSWHMLVHMTFNMLVPALLVLGAPITLLRRVLRSGDQIND